MPTPDWEDWLRRQDIAVEDTTTLEKYIDYLDKELGISGGSLDVAKDIYVEKYDIWDAVGITPFDWRDSTRYAIEGLRGAWGRENALIFGAEMAEQTGYMETANILRRWYEEEFGRMEY